MLRCDPESWPQLSELSLQPCLYPSFKCWNVQTFISLHCGQALPGLPVWRSKRNQGRQMIVGGIIFFPLCIRCMCAFLMSRITKTLEIQIYNHLAHTYPVQSVTNEACVAVKHVHIVWPGKHKLTRYRVHSSYGSCRTFWLPECGSSIIKTQTVDSNS